LSLRYPFITLAALCLAGSAAAGPVQTPWAVSGPDDTAAVAAAALSGWYASADSYEDTVELRDINQSLVRTITKAEISALLPWMVLDGGTDGPNALAFTDSGRLLFIGVHDAAPATDGQGSDAILRYDTQSNQLWVFARLELSASDNPWPHPSLAHFKGRLYAGVPGGISVYDARMNLPFGGLLYFATGTPGAMVSGIAIDRQQNTLYAAWNNTIHRATIGASSLPFVSGGSLPVVRAIAYSDHYGATANAGLYALDSTTAPEAARVWFISTLQARGQQAFAPTSYLSVADDWHDLCATADGKLLIGADEDAVLISDSADTRLGYAAWMTNEFAQQVTFAKSLIAPVSPVAPAPALPLWPARDPAGWVIDGDVLSGARFHPATPDGACWAILLLLMNDELNGDPAAQGLVRTILERYSGRAASGPGASRSGDGIFRHWINPADGQVKPGWDPEYATLSTMKMVLGAARAAAYYPGDASIQLSAREIICGVRNWDAYVNTSTNATYFKGLEFGDPDLSSAASPFHEGMIFAEQAAAYGGIPSQDVYTRWLERWRWPSAALVSGKSIVGVQSGSFLSAFVSLYELLVMEDYRSDPQWQSQVLNLRLSNAAWTDDNGPKYNTVFSAGTTKTEWGGYRADSLNNHPGDITTFTSLMAFAAGTGAPGGSTPEAVAAYNAYRRGARQGFAGGANMLYRRSNVDQAYTPNSAGLPDVVLGALGLAELIDAGSVARVLTGPYPSCAPRCGPADFDGDGDTGTDLDIEAFFACLGGDCCTACWSADFDGDGDSGTDLDIEAFFRVVGGGNC